MCKKALNYLHHSAPIAEALSDSRLSFVCKSSRRIQTLINQQRTNLADVDYLDLESAAKVVENFVNPKISAGNVEKMQKNYTGAVMARRKRTIMLLTQAANGA